MRAWRPHPRARRGAAGSRDGRSLAAVWAVRVAGAVLVLAAAFAGGLGLASTWESTARSDDYAVSARIVTRSQVEIPTNIGTAVFDTHAWGPGARFAVSALALPPVERESGSAFIDLPAQVQEIRTLALDAAVVSAQKFAAGAVGGALLGVLAWRGLRRPPRQSPRRRLAGTVGAAVAAAAVAVGGWGAGAWVTFEEDYGDHLRADGLLALGLSSGRLLQELNSRDQAYAGYVQSLATYIGRLRQEAGPAETADVAVRVLLASDIHGRNIYPQLRGVVRSEQVDLVIDAGDLVQWGTTFELSARPDLTTGIESLGVPYLWVKGNHDGAGTVAQMRRIPNVVVLDGEVAEVAGLRVLGVPDPRLYQDGGPVEAEQPEEVAEMERAAAAEAAAGIAGPVDVAVMHHPSGADELGELTAALVRLSGHTHRPALEVGDDHLDVTIGTTGAAGIRTFKGTDEEGDLAPTPQSFDILDFGPSCRPVSITRFTYPDVLSDAGTARVTYETIRLEAEETQEAQVADGAPEANESDDGQGADGRPPTAPPDGDPGAEAPTDRRCG